jgi:hypothetical protein
MPARDDSVIRGSLIASVIFLVLSLVLNFLLWRMGDTASTEAESAKANLASTSATVLKQNNMITYMKSIIGVGELTQAEQDNLAESAAGDADMEKVITDTKNVLSYFGPEVDNSQRNLTALPEYLVNVIRERVNQYNAVSQAREQEKVQAAAAIKVAQDAQAAAEALQQKAEQEKEDLRVAFEADRQKMKVAGAELQDLVNRQAAEMRRLKDENGAKIASLETEKKQLLATIDLQRREINTLTNPEFEVAQGEVTYTRSGDRLVMINLGSADALRKGVNFAIFDADETRVTDVKPKAMVEVTAIRGDHLAEARILGDAIVSNPIISGDKVYSPFWAPGRKVRIALAGAIDINRNNKGDAEDIDILTGLIEAAGAEVAAVVDGSGQRGGKSKLDSGIRFLVVGERPETSDSTDAAAVAAESKAMAEVGAIIDEARQLGITIIPADKLIGFLKTLDDSITVPLGPTARGSDFQPRRIDNLRRVNGSVSDLYNKAPERSE